MKVKLQKRIHENKLLQTPQERKQKLGTLSVEKIKAYRVYK